MYYYRGLGYCWSPVTDPGPVDIAWLVGAGAVSPAYPIYCPGDGGATLPKSGLRVSLALPVSVQSLLCTIRHLTQ